MSVSAYLIVISLAGNALWAFSEARTICGNPGANAVIGLAFGVIMITRCTLAKTHQGILETGLLLTSSRGYKSHFGLKQRG